MTRAALFAAFVLASVFVTQVPVSAGEAGDATSALDIDFTDGLLSVEARDVPLGEILQAIGDKAGIEVPKVSDRAMPFSGQFSGLGLSEGLARILGRSASYILKYGDGGKPKRLVILSLPASRAPAEGLTDGAPTASEVAAGAPRGADDSMDWVNAQLAASEPGARIAAIWQLRGLPDAEAATIAIDALRVETDANVRARIASLLAGIGGPKPVGALADLLLDPSATVRYAAVQALAAIDSDAAINVLGFVLLRQLGDEKLRLVIIEALAESRSPVAADYLKAVSVGFGGAVAQRAQAAISGNAPINAYRTDSTEVSNSADQPVRSPLLAAAARLADEK